MELNEAAHRLLGVQGPSGNAGRFFCCYGEYIFIGKPITSDGAWATGRIVIGKPITSGGAWATGRIVIGKPITSGSAWATGRIVIGKPITLGGAWATGRIVCEEPVSNRSPVGVLFLKQRRISHITSHKTPIHIRIFIIFSKTIN
ncbi:hypothetical protein NSU18_18325 [Paenibacillus sp. FSL H8-0048]|uniref:hypothetical protein n=1 Tax=Paenibacillus sp. FSL H8-0048 TaxID=2954508 RepID=UPI0030FA093C